MTPAQSPPEPDWNPVRGRVVECLSRLIRYDTTNPPGNELEAARWIGNVLSGAGIPTRVLEATAGRGAVVGRLRGNGARPPLLITAHIDVVGVQASHWSVPPFSGEVRDGYVYGRGAIDDKGMLAANLIAMLLIKEHVVDRGSWLARDVIFAATADEEGLGKYGLGWLIDEHPDLIRAEYAINEGGRIRVVNGKPLYAAVQCAEKVMNIIRVTARGTPGHGSVPRQDNAVVRLARAVAAIGAHREPVKLHSVARAFLEGLAPVWPERRDSAAISDLLSGDAARVESAIRALDRVPLLAAVIRNGISPTILTAGYKVNVIPGEAAATLDVRTLPGERVDDVVERLMALVDDDAVDIEVEKRGEYSPASDFRSQMFSVIEDTLGSLLPGLTVVPYMSTGATENSRLRQWGVDAFGLLPFPLEAGDEERMHGDDERVPVDALLFGTRFLYHAILKIAR